MKSLINVKSAEKVLIRHPISRDTKERTLERNLMLALMKGVAEILPHRVTFGITSVPTVEKELLNVNIPAVIVFLHGQHI